MNLVWALPQLKYKHSRQRRSFSEMNLVWALPQLKKKLIEKGRKFRWLKR